MVSQARIRAPTVLVNLLLKTSLGARRQVAEVHAVAAPQTKRRQEKLRARNEPQSFAAARYILAATPSSHRT